MTYAEKLKDPRWQKKRLEVLERDGWFCQQCGNNKTTLHVHHRVYRHKNDPWEYSNDELITLCEECHELEKDLWEEGFKIITDTLKKEYFGADLINLAQALFYCNRKSTYPSDVTATALEAFCELGPGIEYVTKWYFNEYLNRRKAKDGQ